MPLAIEPLRSEGRDNTVEIITQTKIIECRILDKTNVFEDYCSIQENASVIHQEIITAGTLIHTTDTMPVLAHSTRVLGVTGHPDGTVVWWEDGKKPTVLYNHSSQISSIRQLPNTVAVATVSGHIFLVSFRCLIY